MPALFFSKPQIELFINRHWQKKPTLIRQAFPAMKPYISPASLAGIACELEANTKIVLEKQHHRSWEVLFGPFQHTTFQQLPETHWTLLVNDMNHWSGRFARLLDRFNFIPNWRVDDLMVSHSPQQGSVGPHVDNYDVFLIQARGRKRWQINIDAFNPKDLIPNIDLAILRRFRAQQQWILNPGDMLYLPPGVAHYGVALDEGETYSVGFRAPSLVDLRGAYFEYLLEKTNQTLRYTDPNLLNSSHSGELSSQALANIVALLGTPPLNANLNPDEIAHWFGLWITQPKSIFTPRKPPQCSAAEFIKKCTNLREWRRDESTLIVYTQQNPSHTSLYINGKCFRLNAPLNALAPIISQQRHIPLSKLRPFLALEGGLQLLLTFYRRAYFHLV